MKKTNLKVVAENEQVEMEEMFPELRHLKYQLKNKSWDNVKTLPLSFFFETNEDGEIEGKFGMGSEKGRGQVRRYVVDYSNLDAMWRNMVTLNTREDLKLGIVIDFGKDWIKYVEHKVTQRYMLFDGSHTVALAVSLKRTDHRFQILNFVKDLDGDFNKAFELAEWANDKSTIIEIKNHNDIWKDVVLRHWQSNNKLWQKGGLFFPRNKDTELEWKKWFVQKNPKYFAGMDAHAAVSMIGTYLSNNAPEGKCNDTKLHKYTTETKKTAVTKMKQLKDKNADPVFEGFTTLDARQITARQTGEAETFGAIVEGSKKILKPLYLDLNVQLDRLDVEVDKAKNDCETQMRTLNRMIKNAFDDGHTTALLGGSRDLWRTHMIKIIPQILPYTYSDNSKEAKRLDKINKRLRKCK